MEDRRALIKQTARFAKEDLGTTWRLFATTLLVTVLVQVGIALAPWWPVKLALAALAGLVWVRIFIFYHDWLHGAVFRNGGLGPAILHVYGLLTLSAPSVWRETHDYHHKNNAKMLGASIGSYPLVSLPIWRRMTPSQRRMYAFARHPLTILFGYFTLFMGGMCLSSFLRNPKLHWQSMLALVMHFALVGGLGFAFGWTVPLFHVVLPLMVATASGGYLFYAQHNFPDIELRDRRDWDFVHAALRSSSMFDMGPVMHWLTGNIGYHHIHHLNHRIPFYRLPEAMEAVPALQTPGRTSWRPADIWGCLRLKLWDPKQQRMVTWAEAEQVLSGAKQAA